MLAGYSWRSGQIRDQGSMHYFRQYMVLFLLAWANRLVLLEIRTPRGQWISIILATAIGFLLDPDIFLCPLINPIRRWLESLFWTLPNRGRYHL